MLNSLRKVIKLNKQIDERKFAHSLHTHRANNAFEQQNNFGQTIYVVSFGVVSFVAGFFAAKHARLTKLTKFLLYSSRS